MKTAIQHEDYVWNVKNHVIYAVMTLGDAVSREITDLFNAGHYGDALALDTASTQRLFRLEEQVSTEITAWCQKNHFGLCECNTSVESVSPDKLNHFVSVAQQKRNIGITVNSSGVLLPPKSLWLTYSLCDDVHQKCKSHDCTRCEQKNCPYETK